jgi:AcrR family transcriptional regulator
LTLSTRRATVSLVTVRIRPAAPLDLRARVLAAAVDLIEQRGLAALSMREVARVAGVSHQAPYHHFPDREAILAGVAEEGFSKLGSALHEAVAAADGASVQERTERAATAYVRFACAHPAHFRVMFRADFVDIDRFPDAKRAADGSFDVLPLLVGALRDAGLELSPSLDAHVALHWSICHGLACLLLDGPLAVKIPSYGDAREVVIRDVMAAMRGLIEAKLLARPDRTPPAKAASRRPAKRRKRG